MWAQVNELLFKKYFGTRPVTPLHNLYPSKPIFTGPKDGWTAPVNKLVSLTWLLWALRSFRRFTLHYCLSECCIRTNRGNFQREMS